MTRHINPSHVWDTVHGEVELRSDHLYDLMGLQVSPSYIIYKDGDLIKAKNGKTGKVEFSGEDAAEVIQSAINALPERGGEIFIRGELVCKSSITMRSFLTIRGENVCRSRLVFDGVDGLLADGTMERIMICSIGIEQSRTPYTGEGIKISGSATDTFGNLYLSNLWLRGWGIAIALRHVHGVVAQNVIATLGNTALYIYGNSVNHEYVNCLFSTDEAVKLVRIDYDSVNNKWAEGLQFINCLFFGGTYNMDINEARGVGITNCIFDSASDRAIEVTSSFTPYSSLRFVGNLVLSTPLGIVADNARHLTIVGNCFYCQTINIHLVNEETKYAVIASNWLSGAGAADIKIENAGPYNKIVNNHCLSSAAYNIWEVGSSDYTEIRGNTLLNAGTKVVKVGAHTVVKQNIGYVTENSGVATFSGDGSTTQFAIPHGLVAEPNTVNVTPMSSDAVGDFYVTKDSDYIYVNYLTAPPSGTDNVVLSWRAEV